MGDPGQYGGTRIIFSIYTFDAHGLLEYYRAYEGLEFNTLAGNALYMGPTFHMQATNELRLAAAFSTQIEGHAADNAKFLDLTNFSRNKSFLREVLEF